MHSKGEAGFVVTHREGNGRQPGQVGGRGETHDLDQGREIRFALRQGSLGDERRGQGSRGGKDHIHLFQDAGKVGDQPRAHSLRLDVIHRGEGARQRQVDAHVRAMLAVVLCISMIQRLRHLTGNRDGMRHAPGFQVWDDDLAQLRAHALELIQHGFAGRDHVGGGVPEPRPVDAQRQAAQV